MANDVLDRIRERIEQNRLTETGSRAALAENAHSAERRMGCTFFAGDRVLHLPTGLDGTVVDAMRVNTIGTAPRSSSSAAGGSLATLPSSSIVESVTVQLTDGRVVTSIDHELVKRPVPPRSEK